MKYIFLALLSMALVWLVYRIYVTTREIIHIGKVARFRMTLIESDIETYMKLPAFEVMSEQYWRPLTVEEWVRDNDAEVTP